MTSPVYRVAALVGVLGLAACAATPSPEPEIVEEPVIVVTKPALKPPRVAMIPPSTVPREPPVVVESRASEVDALLADFVRMRRLSASELVREQEAARQAFAQTRSDAARVKLAMTSSVPGSAAADDGRALELLDPLVKNPGASLHSLAFLLAAYIQEQRRLSSMAQGLQQNLQGLQQSNQSLQQNVHALQQKLDALRTLERSLSERGDPAPKRR